MRFFYLIYHYYQKLMKKSYSTLSGAIAFFLIINGGSLLYLTIFISRILDIEFVIGENYLYRIVSNIENSVNINDFLYNIFFIIASVYGASTLFFHLLKVGENIYVEVNEKFSLVKRISAVLFLVAMLLIFELFFILLLLGKNTFESVYWHIFRWCVFILTPYIIVVCINFFITPHQVRFKEIKKGSLFTTLFWFVATLLFNIYLKIFTNYKAIYGAVSFFIIFMIWIYLMAQGLVIGFIINFYEKEKNTKLKMDCSDKNIIGTPDEEENEK